MQYKLFELIYRTAMALGLLQSKNVLQYVHVKQIIIWGNCIALLNWVVCWSCNMNPLPKTCAVEGLPSYILSITVFERVSDYFMLRGKMWIYKGDVLLTVHLSIILVINQLNAQILVL